MPIFLTLIKKTSHYTFLKGPIPQLLQGDILQKILLDNIYLWRRYLRVKKCCISASENFLFAEQGYRIRYLF